MNDTNTLPDYLPARMLNEFVYCPRLFYYEWVDGLFANNRETVEGAIRHAKLDGRADALPKSEALAEGEKELHARSVTLPCEAHGLIAKMDLVEASGDRVTPVDYKRVRPRKNESDGTPECWDADRVQIAVQALVLRDNGYECDEGILYYSASKQRVRVSIDGGLVTQTLDALAGARAAAASNCIPPPLVDSPKCPKCSLVGICLPDETSACITPVGDRNGRDSPFVQQVLFDCGPRPIAVSTEPAGVDEGVRRLVPARDDLRPLYLNSQGVSVGKSSKVLRIKEKTKVIQEVRIHDICQLNLFGNIQLTTQAIQTLCQNEIPIAYFSQGGWFYGITQGLGIKNIFLRREQFRWAEIPSFCLRFARALVAGKIKNQRTMLLRNHVEPPRAALVQMKCMQEDAKHAESADVLLGIEGNAARVYFQNFVGMIKVESEPFGDIDLNSPFRTFDFAGRNRRPPRDPINALLSLGYSVLAKDLTIVCQAVGFDPYQGFFHKPRFGPGFSGARPNGTFPTTRGRLRRTLSDQHANGPSEELCSGRRCGSADTRRPKGLFSRLRAENGHAGHAPALRLPCQLSEDS